MNVRAILCAGSVAVLTTCAETAVAQQGVVVGALTCEVSGGLGLIVTSSKEMNCFFTSATGREPYYGTIRKFGLDIGATDQGILAWEVFAPSAGPKRGALAGDYAGIDASATIGAGVGANALVGGSDRSFTLQLDSSADRACPRHWRRVDDASPRAMNSGGTRCTLLSPASKWAGSSRPKIGVRGDDARPVSPKLVLTCAKRSNAAAKDENPTK